MFVFRASCFGYFGYHSKGCLSVAPFSTFLGFYEYQENIRKCLSFVLKYSKIPVWGG